MSRQISLPVLSVDVDAQLRKLPARRFQRPEHYLVEWIRGALARGATKIDIATAARFVTVEDDGRPVDLALLDDLCKALDHDRDDVGRRAGLERFEQGNGLSVLAALAPDEARVELESGEGKARHRWHLSIGRKPFAAPSQGDAGTRLQVRRRGGAKRERKAVEEYVRFARAQVTLNGKPLHSGAPVDALAYARISEDDLVGHIWIPASGDTCRLWSTSHGVRQRQRVLSAGDGLVYHAAIEAADGQARLPLERLRTEAVALYHLLAKRYASLTSDGRTRADELLFLLHRCGGDAGLIRTFRIFRVLEETELANLDDLQLAGENGPFYALRVEEPRARFDIEGRRILRLTAPQWEFLSERAGIKLLRPPELVKRRRGGALALREMWAGFRRRRGRHLAATRPTIEPHAEFIMVGELLGRFASENVPLFWVTGSGPSPALVATRKGQPGLVLFHDHPEIAQAARELAQTPELAPLWATRLLRGKTNAK
jgi:hypothetical protein